MAPPELTPQTHTRTGHPRAPPRRPRALGAGCEPCVSHTAPPSPPRTPVSCHPQIPCLLWGPREGLTPISQSSDSEPPRPLGQKRKEGPRHHQGSPSACVQAPAGRVASRSSSPSPNQKKSRHDDDRVGAAGGRGRGEPTLGKHSVTGRRSAVLTLAGGPWCVTSSCPQPSSHTPRWGGGRGDRGLAPPVGTPGLLQAPPKEERCQAAVGHAGPVDMQGTAHPDRTPWDGAPSSGLDGWARLAGPGSSRPRGEPVSPPRQGALSAPGTLLPGTRVWFTSENTGSCLERRAGPQEPGRLAGGRRQGESARGWLSRT